jgi:hypothetical protein
LVAGVCKLPTITEAPPKRIAFFLTSPRELEDFALAPQGLMNTVGYSFAVGRSIYFVQVVGVHAVRFVFLEERVRSHVGHVNGFGPIQMHVSKQKGKE